MSILGTISIVFVAALHLAALLLVVREVFCAAPSQTKHGPSAPELTGLAARPTANAAAPRREAGLLSKSGAAHPFAA